MLACLLFTDIYSDKLIPGGLCKTPPRDLVLMRWPAVPKIVDLERNRVPHNFLGSEECHLRRQLLFGSSASRSPSPKRLKATIVMKMASPGMIMYIGSTE